MSNRMEQWRTLILAAFGKRARKKWFLAALDILMIDVGVKASCLFDHWLVTAEDMLTFIMTLCQQNLIKNKVSVLRIGLDVVICSSVHARFLLSEGSPPYFIDISSSLSSPVLASNEKVSGTTKVFSDLCSSLSAVCDSQDLTGVYDVEIPDGLNVPCLFGLLLGYPCVYWYDVAEGDNHCLSGQVLHLFQVKGQIRPCDAREKLTRVPKICLARSAGLDVKTFPCDNCHVILSFTVPSSLIPSIDKCVGSWFAKWRDSVPWLQVFSSVVLEETSVSSLAMTL